MNKFTEQDVIKRAEYEADKFSDPDSIIIKVCKRNLKVNKFEEAKNNIYKHGKTMTEQDAFAILEALDYMIKHEVNE